MININFKICKFDVTSISITGLEKDDMQYCENNCDDNYSYNETVSVNIAVPVNGKEEVDWKNSIMEINDHSEEDDITIIQIPKDGLYKVFRCIIPKTFKGSYNGVVAVFEEDDWKFVDANNLEFLPEELIENTFSDYQYTFTLLYLRNCYFQHVQEYLDKYCSNKCLLPTDTNIIWMSINIIQYMLDLGKLFPALALLEKIQSCVGICNNQKITGFNNACGCNN